MLIAFVAKAGTGKTTASDFLQENDFFKVGFKDAIVQELHQYFPDLLREIAKVEPFDPTMRTKGPLLRALMQNWGTEFRRAHNPNYWLDQWKAKAELLLAEGKNVVCDDARFLNEVEVIRGLGGVIVRLTRPDITDTGSHASETEMDAVTPDFTISSERGDLEGLHQQLSLLLQE